MSKPRFKRLTAATAVMLGLMTMQAAPSSADIMTIYNQDCREVASGKVKQRADFHIQGADDLIGMLFGTGSCTDGWVNDVAIGQTVRVNVDGGDCEYTVEARGTTKWDKHSPSASLTCKEKTAFDVCYCD